ncbi:Putative papain-like cysteine peptidase [Arenibacter nanhaiticus]|uniref:Putative papain-like cysteine peptidase n=1 Tax=Arenibacter nanhaiticus TaxID=558155 RepID=A0A1M6MA48_9FLAO|nr:DUF1796 family putative cysteine peptidase [Arenibacter nanhaiticus]SHJ80301.1 Putative papain-like cysteine peptidase [Arenibacter nanhaiticus]
MIKKYFRNQDSINSEIILIATEISNTINGWLSNDYYEKVSIGENCNSSWYLKETGNKNASYPYDWIFSSGEIITHTIKDEFKSFLNKDMIFHIKKNKAGHSLYHSNLFNHRNPLKSDKDYYYYERGVERFLKLLKDQEKSILFVCTVIQEKEKRLDWTNGFDRDFKLPINQGLDSFTETIKLIQSINNNVKFIFINQLTEGKINLEVTTINSDFIWIDFCSEGANSGVQYRNKFDDLIMKIIYQGMYQENDLHQSV